MTRTLLRGIGRLFTAGDTGVLSDVELLLDHDRIAWVGERVPAELAVDLTDEVDVDGRLVTPGLIDAHTHPLYVGSRLPEVALRSAGLSYADLGPEAGIAATVAATRAAGRRELEAAWRERLRRWAATGTTTVEAKTGYHLERAGELEAVAILAGLGGQPGLPRVSATFLAAHAVPPEAGGADVYVDEVCGWMADARRRGADSADVFCDQGYFTVAQARRVLEAGRAAGLALRVHADELARVGAAVLAAELGARSADHLLWITEEDAKALAAAGVVATLCPGTALSMGRVPPVDALRAAGVELALGSDHNPGTCGITDMTVVVALAVAALRLPVDEALTAATRGGARSLGLADRGQIAPGMVADLVAWDTDHEGAFAWAWGVRPHAVWLRGLPL